MTDRLCSVCSAPLKPRQHLQCSRTCQTKAAGKRKYVYTDEQRGMARQMRAESKSVGVISRETGMNPAVLAFLFKKEGIARPAVLVCKLQHGQRLPEQHDIVRRMYPLGASFEDIQTAVNAIGTYRLQVAARLTEWASDLGVTRPEGWAKTHGIAAWRRSMAARQAAKQAPAPKVVVAAPDKPKTYAPSRAKGEGLPAPAPGAKPITVSKPALIRIGVYDFGLEPDDALDYARVSAAARKADPAHPGFRPAVVGERWLFKSVSRSQHEAA